MLKDVKQKFVDTGLEKAAQVTQGQLGGLVKKEKITQEQADAQLEEIVGPHHRHHRLRGLRRRGLRDRGRARADGDQAVGVRRARRGHAGPRDPRVEHLARSRSPRWPRPPAGPTRSCGFHFFYPASMMRLIEVIEGEETSEETLQAAANFAQADPQDGRSAAARRPGFVVNRILNSAVSEIWRVTDEEGLDVEGGRQGRAGVQGGADGPVLPRPTCSGSTPSSTWPSTCTTATATASSSRPR